MPPNLARSRDNGKLSKAVQYRPESGSAMMLESTTDGENLTAYGRFAQYYAQLVSVTGRLAAETELVLDLLDRHAIRRDATILDLGCGPGLVAERVIKQGGYQNVFAADGSAEMVSLAQRRLSAQHVTEASWESISENCGEHKPYSFIYSLSQSLTHAVAGKISEILLSIYQLLTPGGVFYMDVRPWILSETGEVVEPGRRVGTWRFGPQIERRGVKYWIDDRCEYREDRQYVTYRVLSRSLQDGDASTTETMEITVSYNTLTVDRYHAELQRVGFSQVERVTSESWPYILVAAIR